MRKDDVIFLFNTAKCNFLVDSKLELIHEEGKFTLKKDKYFSKGLNCNLAAVGIMHEIRDKALADKIFEVKKVLNIPH